MKKACYEEYESEEESQHSLIGEDEGDQVDPLEQLDLVDEETKSWLQ